jgi:hypothetical protein
MYVESLDKNSVKYVTFSMAHMFIKSTVTHLIFVGNCPEFYTNQAKNT